MFVVVNDGIGRLEAKAFREYLYSNQAVVVEPVATEFGEAAVISAPDARLAQDVADRYSSAWIGASVWPTLESALARVKEL
jgi:hypothetical protein